MSAGLVTLNNAFKGLKTAAPVLFWPVAVGWTALGGLGHGMAMHYTDTSLVLLLYPLLAAGLLFPVLIDTARNRLGGTLNAALLAALLWWTSWVGWHVAEGARPEGVFTGMAWVSTQWEGNDPYAFDPVAGAAAGVAFARLTPADWISYFSELSESKELREPQGRRRSGRSRPRRLLTPVELRRIWLAEPAILFLSALCAVWPRRANMLLSFAQYLNPRNWFRRKR
ncbi:MAG: hypothetical protein AAFP17_01555 [Pseudomonadota bacterium]